MKSHRSPTGRDNRFKIYSVWVQIPPMLKEKIEILFLFFKMLYNISVRRKE